MLIKMIAEASAFGINYKSGEIYDVPDNVYEYIKQSCKIVDEKTEKRVEKGEGLTRKNYIDYEDQEYESALVIISYGIGNIINKTPLIKKLKELYPGIIIDIIVQKPVYKEVLKGWDLINKIFIPADLYKWDEKRKGMYDLIIGCVPLNLHTERMGLKARKKYIEGENSRIKEMHEITANMNILKQVGWNGDNVPDTHIPVKEVKGFEDGKYIGICAGFDDSENIRWRIKNWGYENYALLMAELIRKYEDYKIIIIGTGHDNKMIEYFPKYGKGCKNIIDCVDKYLIQESAYIVSKCSAIICNDTGISHVASAVGTPSFVIFGPTDQVKNTPQRDSVVISRKLECQPCQYKPKWNTCESFECMDIKPVDIVELFKEHFKTEKDINTEKIIKGIKNNKSQAKYHFYTVAHGERFINAAIRSANSFIHFNPDIKFTVLCLIDEGDDKLKKALMKKFTEELHSQAEAMFITDYKHFDKKYLAINEYYDICFYKFTRALSYIDGSEYICFVDADTLCMRPLKFSLIEPKLEKNLICVVGDPRREERLMELEKGGIKWKYRNIYFNSGVVFFNNKNKSVFSKEFYQYVNQHIDDLSKLPFADQTWLNCFFNNEFVKAQNDLFELGYWWNNRNELPDARSYIWHAGGRGSEGIENIEKKYKELIK